jgi:hypothetical protein
MEIDKVNWLHEIISISEFEGNWDSYLETVYDKFKYDLVTRGAVYCNTLVRLTNEGKYDSGKLILFWHIIQKEGKKGIREPDFARMERIPWIKPVIENSKSSNILVWREKRKHEIREHILLDNGSDTNYLVVILVREKKNYTDYFLVTAFPPNKRYLNNLHERYKKANPGSTEVRTLSTTW